MEEEKYIEENDELFKTFLNTTFFKSWYNYTRDSKKSLQNHKIPHNYSSLELDIDHHCNLNCGYCYLKKYGKSLYRENKIDKNKILENLEKIMIFLKENKMTPETIDIFTGEFFNLSYWQEIFDIIYSYLKEIELNNRTPKIAIPTNFVAMIDKGIEKEVIYYVKKFKDIEVDLIFSASFDGPFLDDINRPKKQGTYSKSFYKKTTDFLEKTSSGTHPMLYSKSNEYTLDNIMWFLDSSKTIKPYLLEVRNTEWNIQELKIFYYSMRSYILYISKKYNFDIEEDVKKDKNSTRLDYIWKEAMKENNNDNIMFSMFNTIGRGIGCSIQSDIQLQLIDLSILPCHRLSYEGLIAAKLDLKEDGSWDLKTENPELYLAIQSTNIKQMSQCTNCPINTLCSGTCIASNYESTGEIFTPAPNVCLLEFIKVSAIIDELDELGMVDYMIEKISLKYNDVKKYSQINYIRNTNIENYLKEI